MKRFLSGLLLCALLASFVLSYMTLIQKRHDMQILNAERDKLRSENYHLRDVNRNLQLEYGALFDSGKMHALAERLDMVAPSLADGNLLYWEEKP